MKHLCLSLFLCLCLLFGCTAGKKQAIKVGSKKFYKLSDSAKDSVLVANGILPEFKDSAAYAIGVDYAKNMLKVGISGLNTKAFTQAVGDVLAKRDLKMATGEASQKVRDFAKNKLKNSASTAEEDNANDPNLAYALGVNHARNLKKSGLAEINSHALANAINKVLAGDTEKLLISSQLSTQLIQEYLANLQAKIEKENLRKGEAFLAKNKERQEVIVTESGLQYEILTEGTGEKPSIEDEVKVHYRGMFIDGSVFDDSIERGDPATFPVSGVIKGWIEVLQLMPVGSKWKVFIPSDLAYGIRGAGVDIGPNETLIFEVDLLGIEGKE